MPRETTSVEVTQAMIKKLSIGDKVTVRLEGTVEELEGQRTFEFSDDDTETFPPRVTVKVSNTKVSSGENQFEQMLDDEEDES